MARRIFSLNLAAACLFAAAAGCDDNPPTRAPATPTTASATASPVVAPARPIDAPTHTIVVLGDATRLELIAKLASASGSVVKSEPGQSVSRVKRGGKTIDFVTASGDGAAAHAKLARRADAALLAVDATQGPLPITREHALVARQMKVPEVVIAFTRTKQVNDPDLLELQELEVREILSLYLLPEKRPRCMMDDSGSAAPREFEGAKGAQEIVEAIAGAIENRPEREAMPPRQTWKTVVYALAPKEAFVRPVAAALDNGVANVMFGDDVRALEVSVASPIEPAGNGDVSLRSKQPLDVAIGDHFVILRDDHIAAVGTVVPD